MVSFSLNGFMLNRKVYGGCLIWPTQLCSTDEHKPAHSRFIVAMTLAFILWPWQPNVTQAYIFWKRTFAPKTKPFLENSEVRAYTEKNARIAVSLRWHQTTVTSGVCHSTREWVSRGLTSHSTLYRSFRGRFLQVSWPNQQCKSTEGIQLATEKDFKSHLNHSTVLQYEL